ncbi:coiled-coil domain-containing protein 17 [Myripristis murdjan]|uniref:coiled-coil domain-containing protein 17 n=1 Tax=Myripristis murdjan TaxID=586833 RepID=UPI001175D7BA|nr:coiled-coil domain-containing protein 17 [Myripristis murdjan]
MKEMAEHHERQLAQIHAHNQHLELQREELACQLDVLAEQSSTSHLESLLTELREQEQRNEETLQQLAEHLHALHVKQTSAPADQPEPREKKTFDLISSVDGSLSAQIKSLRQAYMQSGGSDPAIVAQIIDLQAEAQTLEQNQQGPTAKTRRKKVRPPSQGQSWELLALERENQRLEEEILRLQLARERHHGHEAAVRTDLQPIQRENLLHHMASLQAEMDSLGREVERTEEAPRHRRQPHPPLPFSSPFQVQPQPALHPLAHIHAPLTLARSCTSSVGRHVVDHLDSLGPAPYNPVAGFVIFYDLVLGVDANLKVLRLVAALYLSGEEVGHLTPLPPVQCQSRGTLPCTHSLHNGNYTPLSVKQFVPRMQPSPSLSLVVELQAAGGLDIYEQEVQKLESHGWAQLELFDQHNQLHSGHWRAPVRSLPVQPSLTHSQLNSIPQVDNMELCVRLVNARDGDMQTDLKPDPSHYKYLAVVSSHPGMVQGNPALSIPSSQPTGANQFPSDHQEDPPPLMAANQS